MLQNNATQGLFQLRPNLKLNFGLKGKKNCTKHKPIEHFNQKRMWYFSTSPPSAEFLRKKRRWRLKKVLGLIPGLTFKGNAGSRKYTSGAIPAWVIKIHLLPSLAELGPLLPAGIKPSGIITVLMKKKSICMSQQSWRGLRKVIKANRWEQHFHTKERRKA